MSFKLNELPKKNTFSGQHRNVDVGTEALCTQWSVFRCSGEVVIVKLNSLVKGSLF